jgi:hypothetical protein
MLSEDIEMVGQFVEQCAGRDTYRDAWNRIKTALAELGTSPNTQKPSASQIADEMLVVASNIEMIDTNDIASMLREWCRQLRLL